MAKDYQYVAKVGGKWLKGKKLVAKKDEATKYESETEPKQIINQLKKDGKIDKEADVQIKKLKEDIGYPCCECDGSEGVDTIENFCKMDGVNAIEFCDYFGLYELDNLCLDCWHDMRDEFEREQDARASFQGNFQGEGNPAGTFGEAIGGLGDKLNWMATKLCNTLLSSFEAPYGSLESSINGCASDIATFVYSHLDGYKLFISPTGSVEMINEAHPEYSQKSLSFFLEATSRKFIKMLDHRYESDRTNGIAPDEYATKVFDRVEEIIKERLEDEASPKGPKKSKIDRLVAKYHVDESAANLAKHGFVVKEATERQIPRDFADESVARTLISVAELVKQEIEYNYQGTAVTIVEPGKADTLMFEVQSSSPDMVEGQFADAFENVFEGCGQIEQVKYYYKSFVVQAYYADNNESLTVEVNFN